MATNTYVPLATQTLSSNQSSVTFSSIPSTYTDLILIGSAKRNVAGSGDDNYNVTFNGDTGNNYSVTLLYENSPYSTRSSNRANLNWMGATGSAENIPSIVHIMNYSNSTTFKTALGRWGSPSDGIVRASVGLWRNTNAITSLTITPAQGIANGSTFSLYGVAAASVGAKATGGTIYSDDSYFYHVFNASGTFTPTQSLTADVLVVAGGGGADNGGGGAGGVIAFASQSLTATGYTCTVGGGGTAGGTRTNGSNSQFGSLTAAVGGGYGGSTTGNSGGSGGGSWAASGVTAGGAGTSGQGNNGGSSGSGGGGGGGGAGAAGSNATSGTQGGAGGAGTNNVTNWGALSSVLTTTGLGVNGFIAGGGGGYGSTTNSVGGSGGGGTGGAAGASLPASAGVANTGSGGGNGANGLGGSGVVIVRYAR